VPQLCLPPHTPQNQINENSENPSGEILNKSTCCDLYNTENEDVLNDNPQSGVNIKNNSKGGFCYYLAIMLFARYFSMLSKKGIDFILPWLISVLLGAKNIEQTKTLNHSAMGLILGQKFKSTKYQRKELKVLAKTQDINKLWAFNIEMAGLDKSRDYYYDPHTKHYTGLRNILKGWCSKVRMADKAINMDYIHGSNGCPLFMDIADNFDDMRVRFFRNIDAFRKVASISQDEIINVIVDRAIYSEETICEIAQNNKTTITTWEKDYKKDKWSSTAETKSGAITRKRNHSRDLRTVKYQYQERQWHKNPTIRQIIVRISSPTGDGTIEISILSGDLGRDADILIFLMFNRWIQENDFKYSIAHFGINEITSYEYMDYQEYADQVQDKMCISGKYKALCIELDRIRARLKTALYKAHRLERAKLKKKLTKQQLKRKEELEQEISKFYTQLTLKEYERQNTDEKTSKIQELIENKKQILNPQTKRFMDAIKIIARNIFYLQFQGFREKYDNYRDDLAIFRSVTRSHGVITQQDGYYKIKILPVMDLPPSLKKIFCEMINEINQEPPVMPDGSNKQLKFVLDDEIESFFAYSNWLNSGKG
jgi:hypothetical protein